MGSSRIRWNDRPMTSKAPGEPTTASVRSRSERPATRGRLIETAGRIFAEKGFDRATGVEICRRAGANAAAINYHFGGMQGLYEAVLEEARRRLPNLEAFSAAATGDADARDRLRALMALAVSILTGPRSRSWVLRVMGREIIAPSPAFERLLLKPEAVPRVRFFRTMIAEIMHLPVDDPAVARGCISVLAPCQLMLIANRDVVSRAYPDVDLSPAGAQALVAHLAAFALAGLDAIAAAAKA